MIASADKDTRGFDGWENAYAASKPLTIHKVFSAGFSLPERISAPAKLRAPDSDVFMSDFFFLRGRWAAAHHSEKSKKRFKDALSGVCALICRFYYSLIKIFSFNQISV